MNHPIESAHDFVERKALNCTPTELLSIVQNAIEEFNLKEMYLVRNDLSERCICGRLAMHLQRALDEFDTYREVYADIEYNRGCHGNDAAAKRGYNDELMIPDIIVHQRGHDPVLGYQNLICIEMKKDKNEEGFEGDKARLKEFTDRHKGFMYRLGCMLVVYSDTEHNRIGIEIESAYVEGKQWDFCSFSDY